MFRLYSWFVDTCLLFICGTFGGEHYILAFIHSIFRQYVAVRIVFIKLINLVLLHMASPCVDFVGFSRGGIPPPSFFSFDFFWSPLLLTFFYVLFVPFLLLFSFSNCLVVLFVIFTTCMSSSVSFSWPRREMENVLYTLRNVTRVKLNLCV